MFSQNKLYRLILSIYVKLHIKSRGLFSTPFKPGNGYYRRKQQQDNKPLNIYTNDIDEWIYSFKLQIKYNRYTVTYYTCYTYIRNLEIQIKFHKSIFL